MYIISGILFLIGLSMAIKGYNLNSRYAILLCFAGEFLVILAVGAWLF